MNSEQENNTWDQTTILHREVMATKPVDAPFGFATRVVARYQELRQNEIFRAWERLSIRTAMVCTACAALFGLYSVIGPGAEEEELIEVPAITLETGLNAFE